MKFKNPFKDLTKFEFALWFSSVVVVTASFLIPHDRDYLTLIASLIGVTALIFCSKGYALGQMLIIAFAVFYGIISFHFKYYGEVITYLGMSAPMAVIALISWLRHPYKSTKEVEVNRMSKRQVLLMLLITSVVTVAFYFILKAFETANLVFSAISVATSFLAVYMTFMRSPYYAVGYALNDIVLIVLWIMAALENPSYIPMILCFIMFLINDIYGFVNWLKMEKKQHNI